MDVYRGKYRVMRARASFVAIAYLEQEIPKMKRNSLLFRTLKRLLTERGHWKNLPRGKVAFSAVNEMVAREPIRVEIGDDFAERVLDGQ